VRRSPIVIILALMLVACSVVSAVTPAPQLQQMAVPAVASTETRAPTVESFAAGSQGSTTLESQPDPTAHWKTYSGFGVSFRYPQDWTLGGVRSDPANDRTGDAVFEADDGYEVHFNAYDDPGNQSYAELMKQYYPALSARYTKSALELVTTIGGVQFYRVRIPAEESGNIVFQRNESLYVISSGSIVTDRQGINALNVVLTLMLSTFRFTNR
jgi:hypothetical protein